MLENIKNWKTTLMGIVIAIIPILVLTGIISVEQSDLVSQSASQVIEAVSVAATAAAGAWLVLKAKDKDK